jgi:hypothetical protein
MPAVYGGTSRDVRKVPVKGRREPSKIYKERNNADLGIEGPHPRPLRSIVFDRHVGRPCDCDYYRAS